MMLNIFGLISGPSVWLNLSLTTLCPSFFSSEKPSLVIPENLEDVTVSVGDPADFLFEIGGFPAPTVSWSKAGQPFEPSDRVQMVSLPNAATMLISRCQPDDSSEYTITVANKHGEESATVRVKVIGEFTNHFLNDLDKRTISLK